MKDDVVQQLHELRALQVMVPTETLLAQVHRSVRRRRTSAVAAGAALALTLVAGVLLGTGGSHRASPPVAHRPNGLSNPSSVFRLDDQRLLVATAHLDVLNADGTRDRIATLGAVVQVLTVHGTWYALTSDCSATGLHLYRSTDEGRTWVGGQAVGSVNCSAGSYGRLSPLHAGLVLVTHEDDAPQTSTSTSTDGMHWSRTQRLYSSANRFAVQDDGSYVGGGYDGTGLGGYDRLWHAAAIGDPEVPVGLPAGVQAVASSVTTTATGFLVMGRDGHAYTSSNGTSWRKVSGVVPGCPGCADRALGVVSPTSWWVASTTERHHTALAFTTDSGSHWQAVPPPPTTDASTFNVLVPWGATSAAVQHGREWWLTTDAGQSWKRLVISDRPVPAATLTATGDGSVVASPAEAERVHTWAQAAAARLGVASIHQLRWAKATAGESREKLFHEMPDDPNDLPEGWNDQVYVVTFARGGPGTSWLGDLRPTDGTATDVIDGGGPYDLSVLGTVYRAAGDD